MMDDENLNNDSIENKINEINSIQDKYEQYYNYNNNKFYGPLNKNEMEKKNEIKLKKCKFYFRLNEFFEQIQEIIENILKFSILNNNNNEFYFIKFNNHLGYFFSYKFYLFSIKKKYFIIINNNNYYKIYNFNIKICFETFLKFYFYHYNNEIINKSENILFNILSINYSKEEKKIFFNKLISILNENLKTKNEEIIYKTLNLLQKFLCPNLNNFNIKKGQNGTIKIKFRDNFENKEKIYELNININEKISNIKNNYINNIPQFEREKYLISGIIFQYKGKILKDDFTIDEYKIKNNSTIFIFKNDPSLKKKELNNEEINEIIINLKQIFPQFENEIFNLALKKNDFNLENTTIYLMNEENIFLLKNEIEENKNKIKNINEFVEFKKEEIFIFKKEEFYLLINLLDFNNIEIDNIIFNILSIINFPENLIKNIINKNYNEIFDFKNYNFLLLNLFLINSMILKFNNRFNKEEINEENRNSFINDLIINENNLLLIFNIIENIFNNFKIINNSQIEIINLIFFWLNDFIIKSYYIKENKENKNDENKNYKILSKENANEFLNLLNKNKIVILIYNLIGKNYNYKNNIQIYLNFFSIISTLSRIKNEEIENLLLLEKNNQYLINILFENNNNEIKKYVKNFYSVLFRFFGKNKLTNNNNNNNDQTINDLCGEIIINNINKIFINDKNYNNFFELLIEFIQFNQKNLNKLNINFKEFILKILETSFELSLNIQNVKNEEKIVDFFSLFLNLLKYKNEISLECLNELNNNKNINLINFLYESLLKIEEDENLFSKINYKFKSKNLRNISYEILFTLIKNENIENSEILNKLIEYIKLCNLSEIDIEISDYKIPFRFTDDKFIGFRNYGATCYINSLIQQLFMMPSFNKALYDLTKNNNNNKSSLIYNLQYAFYNLRHSSKKYYPALHIINSIPIAFNGEAINVKIQQDSDEFFNILCDELEKEGKMLFKNENFLTKSFKGKISNEINSLENDFPYYNSTDEFYTRIQLEIKGHKTLEEALNSYIKEEILDGDNKYFIEKYNKKISISKRASIKTLTDNIIIYLKRFEFDYETFLLKKLNDYLNFPKEINFMKWTRMNLNENKKDFNFDEEEKNNLNKENLDYVLTGILVHSGTSLESGHYYSLIMNQENEKWFKFDDTAIDEFDFEKNLEKECFGENDNFDEEDCFKNCNTAYLLFYTKKKCLFKNNQNLYSYNVDENIVNRVREENVNFLRGKYYIEDNFNWFFKNFILFKMSQENSNENEREVFKEVYYQIFEGDDDEKNDKNEEKKEIKEKNEEKKVDNNNNKNKIKFIPSNFLEIYNKCKQEIEKKKNENNENNNENNKNNNENNENKNENNEKNNEKNENNNENNENKKEEKNNNNNNDNNTNNNKNENTNAQKNI